MTVDTSGLYRDITDSARSAPGWVQSAFEAWTEYGLVLFGLLFIAVWWRARTQDGPRAVALALAVRRLALLTVPLALLMAFSRVFVGVHYPHDVVVGLLLGGSLAALFVLALTGPISTITAAMRASGGRAAVRFTGPGPARQP